MAEDTGLIKPSYTRILTKRLIMAVSVFCLLLLTGIIYLENSYNVYLSSCIQNAGYTISSFIKDGEYNNRYEAMHRILLMESRAPSTGFMQEGNVNILVGVIKVTKDDLIHDYICTEDGYFIELTKDYTSVVYGNSDSQELRDLYMLTQDNGVSGIYFTRCATDSKDIFYPIQALNLTRTETDDGVTYTQISHSEYTVPREPGLITQSILRPDSSSHSTWRQEKPMEYYGSPNIKLTYELLTNIKMGDEIPNDKYTYISSVTRFNNVYDIVLVGIKRSPFEIIGLMEPVYQVSIYIFFPVLFIALIILALMLSRSKYSKLESDYRVYESQIQMTRSMAHDLKTPLAALSGYAENMASESDIEKRNYYAGKIEDNAHSMANIIDKILQFSKTADEYKLTNESLDVKTIASDCLLRTDNEARTKDLTVNITGTKVLKADRMLFTQALSNLTDNAVKYSKEGTTINIFIGDKTLTITNIPSSPLTKKADELLKPFVRDDESRNITKGTGLGLAIAQRDLSLLGMDLGLKCDNDLFTVTIRY